MPKKSSKAVLKPQEPYFKALMATKLESLKSASRAI